MYLYSVGGPFVPGRTHWNDGQQYNYALNHHQIALIWSRLTPAEVKAVANAAIASSGGLWDRRRCRAITAAHQACTACHPTNKHGAGIPF